MGKITLEEFRNIKRKLLKIFDEYDKLYEESGKPDDEITADLEDKYRGLLNELFGYDLSDIPFEEWQDVIIVEDDNNPFDFSKNHANFDFEIVPYFRGCNYRECNIKNLDKLEELVDPNDFNNKTISMYPSLFLSEKFDSKFKKKYYSGSLTIEDMSSLSYDQLEEIKQKKYEQCLDYNSYSIAMLETLGLDKMVQLYKKSPQEYESIKQIFDKCFYNNLYSYSYYYSDTANFLKELKNVEVSRMKDVCFEFLKHDIIYSSSIIRQEDYPELFIRENPELFLLHATNLPDEIKDRYKNRRLRLQDLIDYKDVFQNIPIDYFMNNSNCISRFIRDNFGVGNYQKLVKKHPDVFGFIIKEGSYNFQDFLKKGKDLDSTFNEIIKQYVLKYIINGNKQLDRENPTTIEIPEWLKSMGLKFVKKLNTTDDLLKCDELTIVFDESQRLVLDTLGLENIKRFEKETCFFSHHYFDPGKDLDVFEPFIQFFRCHNMKTLTEKGIDFKSGNLPYEEFLSVFSKCLDFMRNNYLSFYSYDWMRGEFRDNHPEIFMDLSAPEDLKKAFYIDSIMPDLLQEHQEYIPYLIDKDLSNTLIRIPLKMFGDGKESKSFVFVNFIDEYVSRYGNKKLLELISKYGAFLSDITISSLNGEIESEKEIEKCIIEHIYNKIIQGNDYSSLIDVNEMRSVHPELFLDDKISPEIKKKFYKREFTLQDFSDNPDLFNIFGNTNIVCAFPPYLSWIIPLFDDNNKIANYKRLKVIAAYLKIQDFSIGELFKNYIIQHSDDVEPESIENISKILSALSMSNSSEICKFRGELAAQILKTDNPEETLRKIEDVFIKNNIPTVGKVYYCFEILHPNFQGFNFESSTMSPMLKQSSLMSKKLIVFSDLIKSSFGSNNKSVKEYLKSIEIGSVLYEKIRNGQLGQENIGDNELKALITFREYLVTLYNNTLKAKNKNEGFKSTENVLEDILELSKKLSPDGTLDFNLADRVIRMFCGFVGIDTLEEAKEYIDKKIKNADARNRNASSSDMVLEQGDFIKGLRPKLFPNESQLKACLRVLPKILQNGSNSKEFLGVDSGSDATPLDTDISMIMTSDGIISEKMGATEALEYGPIWFVLKNDDRFITTRTDRETFDVKRDLSKLEVFYTGVAAPDHYGIRTGFASSEINYIVMENYDPRVGLEIAMNGFYIPVANKEGKIVFTPKDYDELRTKMSGLSYFDENNYTFSENLITEETKYFAEQIEQSNYEVQVKREKINSIIKKSLEELGLHLKTNIDGDLSEGFVEFIDTGSTGRGTNKPGDGDFDFMMLLDKAILSNPARLNELKRTILRNLGGENSSELTGTGDFRLKGVSIDTDKSVDIDITFAGKTDKVSYSTDMALRDRLATIQRNDPEKYKYVVANILLAKQVLKKAEAYKPNRGEIPQGGLGGVGIENWILQNGGSFIDAAKCFVAAAEGKSFSEFQSAYQIWDFGDNYLAERRGLYSHDNFVSNNMSEAGYQKMVKALKEYLKTMDISQMDTETINR